MVGGGGSTRGVRVREDLDDSGAVDKDAERCNEVLACGFFFGTVEGVKGSESLDEELDDFGTADGDEEHCCEVIC